MSDYDKDYFRTPRRDARQVVRATGSGTAWFWMILIGIFVVFWPSIYHRDAAVCWAWYGSLTGITVMLITLASIRK